MRNILKRLKEIKEVSLELDPQTILVNIWYRGWWTKFNKRRRLYLIYQKLDNKAKIFND
jgi:hypothetical protein